VVDGVVGCGLKGRLMKLLGREGDRGVNRIVLGLFIQLKIIRSGITRRLTRK
jgi:hypothetical protein